MKFPIVRVSKAAGLYGNPNLVVLFTSKNTGTVLFTTQPDRYTIGKPYEDLTSAYNTSVWRGLYAGERWSLRKQDDKLGVMFDAIVDHSVTAGTDFQCSLRDILTDLRLLADLVGIDFDKANEGSAEVYAEEEKEILQRNPENR